MSQLKVVRKDSSLNKGVHCECQKQIIDGKKDYCYVYCVVSVAFSLEARQRTEAEALRIARSFYEGQGMLRLGPGIRFSVGVYGRGSGLRSVSSDPYYYIYNVGEGDGFVMVSGDDRVARCWVTPCRALSIREICRRT